MNPFKKFLKYWITLSSVAGFLLGWIFVAQNAEESLSGADSVNRAAGQAEASVLPPVTTLESLVGQSRQQAAGFQPFTVIQSQPQFQPQMRTGGS